MIFFSIFVNKVILGSLSAVWLENMITKTLLLPQIAVIIYETSSELSSQLSSQNSVWDFWLKRIPTVEAQYSSFPLIGILLLPNNSALKIVWEYDFQNAVSYTLRFLLLPNFLQMFLLTVYM